jgi:hypothetical protein
MTAVDERIARLTPEQLARFVARLGEAAAARPAAPPGSRLVPRQSAGAARPLSFAQERLWFSEQLHPGSGDYNVAGALRLRGAVKLAAFDQALREVVRRHEVLRASFDAVLGQPVQVVAEDVPWRPLHVDVRGLAAAAREVAVERAAGDESGRGFDLRRAPLLRVVWLTLGSGECVLLYTVHHLVCDGWSLELLTAEVAELYRAFAAGLPSPLPEPPLQYGDFAAWQREQLTAARRAQLLDFWWRQLHDASPRLDMPGLLPSSPGGEGRAAEEVLRLDPATAAGLRALGREEGATLFMVFAALFSVALHLASGQDDLCLGASVAQRGDLETEGLIGCFVNQVVLRVRLRRDGSCRELLRQVKSVAEQAHAHQDLPFESVVEALRNDRRLGRSPLFQAKVAFHQDREAPVIAGLELAALDHGRPLLRCDLMATGVAAGAEIGATLTYDTSRLQAEAVRQLAAALADVAECFAAAPDLRLAELAAKTADTGEHRRARERRRLDRLGTIKLRQARRKGVPL